MGLIGEKDDCNFNQCFNVNIKINSHNVCWKGKGILKRSKLTTNFHGPERYDCSEPSEDGMVANPALLDRSSMQRRDGVLAGLTQQNGSIASPKKNAIHLGYIPIAD